MWKQIALVGCVALVGCKTAAQKEQEERLQQRPVSVQRAHAAADKHDWSAALDALDAAAAVAPLSADETELHKLWAFRQILDLYCAGKVDDMLSHGPLPTTAPVGLDAATLANANQLLSRRQAIEQIRDLRDKERGLSGQAGHMEDGTGDDCDKAISDVQSARTVSLYIVRKVESDYGPGIYEVRDGTGQTAQLTTTDTSFTTTGWATVTAFAFDDRNIIELSAERRVKAQSCLNERQTATHARAQLATSSKQLDAKIAALSGEFIASCAVPAAAIATQSAAVPPAAASPVAPMANTSGCPETAKLQSLLRSALPSPSPRDSTFAITGCAVGHGRQGSMLGIVGWQDPGFHRIHVVLDASDGHLLGVDKLDVVAHERDEINTASVTFADVDGDGTDELIEASVEDRRSTQTVSVSIYKLDGGTLKSDEAVIAGAEYATDDPVITIDVANNAPSPRVIRVTGRGASAFAEKDLTFANGKLATVGQAIQPVLPNAPTAPPVVPQACTIASLHCEQFSTQGRTGRKLHELVFGAEQAGRHAEAICLALSNLNTSDKWLAGAANFDTSRAWDGLGCPAQAIAAIEASLAVRPRDQGGWKETCDQCRKIGAACAACDDSQRLARSNSTAATVDRGETGSNTSDPPPMWVSLVQDPPRVFEVWEAGKKVMDGPGGIQVAPGHPRTIVIKGQGWKDKTLIVDGRNERVEFKLELAPDCKSTLADPKSADCRAQFCEGHADDARCHSE